jgi:threonine aldolase
MAYGADPWNAKAQELFKETFGPQAEGYIVYNGTAANVCSLTHLLSPWQAVLCTESAHIWTDECGAASAIGGCTLLPVASNQGKLTPDRLEEFLHYRGNEHHVQPAPIFAHF